MSETPPSKQQPNSAAKSEETKKEDDVAKKLADEVRKTLEDAAMLNPSVIKHVKRVCTRKSVERLMRRAGVKSHEDRVLVDSRLVLIDILRALTRDAIILTKHNNKSTIKKDIVRRALQRLGKDYYF